MTWQDQIPIVSVSLMLPVSIDDIPNKAGHPNHNQAADQIMIEVVFKIKSTDHDASSVLLASCC